MATGTHAKGRTLIMSQSLGQVRLRRDGPVERHARAVELGAWAAGLLLVASALLAWSPFAPASTADLRIAVTLSALSGAWPLLRLAFCGVRYETVFDVGAQEFRQHRMTAGGRARTVLTLPIDLVNSVHIHRAPPGMPSHLAARDAAGKRIYIGTAPLAQLERMHHEIVAALCLAPARTGRPRRGVSPTAMTAAA
ncbi:hypothetical protein [Palleronia sp.]|uniref:hypothetical protein n=1 Tax=Palleronia sp. TaxID=1940284 RepID=UPI0035C8194D